MQRAIADRATRAVRDPFGPWLAERRRSDAAAADAASVIAAMPKAERRRKAALTIRCESGRCTPVIIYRWAEKHLIWMDFDRPKADITVVTEGAERPLYGPSRRHHPMWWADLARDDTMDVKCRCRRADRTVSIAKIQHALDSGVSHSSIDALYQ